MPGEEDDLDDQPEELQNIEEMKDEEAKSITENRELDRTKINQTK